MKLVLRLAVLLTLAFSLNACSKCGGFLDLGLPGKPAACGDKGNRTS